MDLTKAKITENIPENMPWIAMEVFDKKVTFAYTTRGNDIYYRLVTYLLHQKHVFKNMNLVSAVNMWRPSLELMFHISHRTDPDFLQILDSDIAPRKDTTAFLMQRDVDIVGCPIWFYDGGTNSIHLNYHTDDKCLREFTPKPPDVGLEKVFATSFGCVVIKRRVLDMFMQTDESFTEWSDMLDPKFKIMAPDTIFFAKCNAFGFDVFLDWGCEFATHHKYVALNAPTVEAFVAHRLFDKELGVEEKRDKLQTASGRDELQYRLQRGAPADADGSDNGSGPDSVPCEAGQAAADSGA